jgi:tetratricopeptide (TPR) repeat protein
MCVKPHTPAEAETFHRIEELTARLEAGETAAQIYLERGRAYKQVAHLAEAIDDLTHALDARPPLSLDEQAMAYNLRGLAHRRLAHYTSAIADLTRSVELRPDHAPFWADRGWAYTCGGLPEQALPDFARCFKLHPYFLGFIYRGLTYFLLGNYRAALADYDRVIELYPNEIAFNSYLNRAILRLLVHQDAAEAEADLNIAVQRTPDAIRPDPRPHAYRGLARALQGRLAEAWADLEAGQALGDDLMIPLARGYIHHRRGEPQAMQDEMITFLRQSRTEGMTTEHSLHIVARFMENPVSVIPDLLPLVA